MIDLITQSYRATKRNPFHLLPGICSVLTYLVY